MRSMLNNFEMRIFRRDVRHIHIEKISIEHTSVGLASARPNYDGVPTVTAFDVHLLSQCHHALILPTQRTLDVLVIYTDLHT